ncbi:MAG: hypothetical protein AAFX87_14945 [Bacteroidota bacterium]
MRHFLLLLSLIFLYGCAQEGSSEFKIFEIAKRQSDFNQLKVIDIRSEITNIGQNEQNSKILSHVQQFHDQMVEFQAGLRDDNTDPAQIRTNINKYLNDFLQQVNPELNHESFLDGAVSNGLLALELANIEKSFLQDQEFRISKAQIDFDNIEAFLIPERTNVQAGEKVKANLILAATSSKWGDNVMLDVNGHEVLLKNGKGTLEFESQDEYEKARTDLNNARVIFSDSVYHARITHW